ncbi:hypothetical protein Tco_0457296, partial [Tanacetum coccineum]
MIIRGQLMLLGLGKMKVLWLCKSLGFSVTTVRNMGMYQGNKDDTDDDSDDQELEAHYMYMTQLQEVTPDSIDNSGPIFDDEPMHK